MPMFKQKGRAIDWESEVIPKINDFCRASYKTLSEALVGLLRTAKNNVTEAAGVAGVSRGALRRQIALLRNPDDPNDPLNAYYRTKPAPPVPPPRILDRIEVVFDYAAWEANKKTLDASVCHFCSNKNGDKMNLTCIFECPARTEWAEESIKAEQELGFPYLEKEACHGL